jgi:hypothetical protein
MNIILGLQKWPRTLVSKHVHLAVICVFLLSLFGYSIANPIADGICWNAGDEHWDVSQSPPLELFGPKYPAYSKEPRIIGLIVAWLRPTYTYALILLTLLSIARSVVLQKWGPLIICFITFLSILVSIPMERMISEHLSCDLIIQHKNIELTYSNIVAEKITDIKLQYYEDLYTGIVLVRFKHVGENVGGEMQCTPYVVLDPHTNLGIPPAAQYPKWFSARDFSNFPTFYDDDIGHVIHPIFGQDNKLDVKSNNIRVFDHNKYTLISCFPA